LDPDGGIQLLILVGESDITSLRYGDARRLQRLMPRRSSAARDIDAPGQSYPKPICTVKGTLRQEEGADESSLFA
jgi:hypothetical protein